MMTFKQYVEAKDKLVDMGKPPKKTGATSNMLLARGAIRPAKPAKSFSGLTVPGKIFSREKIVL